MRLVASSRSASASLRAVIAAALAAALAAGAGAARAAEVTRVASREAPDKPFSLHLSAGWERFQERAQITREVATAGGQVVDGDELRTTRTVSSVVTRLAVAIAEDLEVSLAWPYVLNDDRAWRFGVRAGASTGGGSVGLGPASSIEANGVDASGNPCAGAPCPLFPVAPSTTVYHGGRFGDLRAGVAWGVFDERKDAGKPSWLVALDVTFPTAARYDPAAGRGTDWSSPYDLPPRPGPFGEKVWKFDLRTVLSRRVGPLDPYVKAHVQLMARSGATYSNCDHADALAGLPVPQMNGDAPAACRAGGADTRAKLPLVTGLTFGSELVAYENAADEQKVAIDLRLWGDYTTAARFYNELTDASGKLHWTDAYLTVGSMVGLYYRTSRHISFQATASLSTKTDHYLTGETPGRNRTWDAAQPNPNFDWRYDAPGRRFRLSEVALLDVELGMQLLF